MSRKWVLPALVIAAVLALAVVVFIQSQPTQAKHPHPTPQPTVTTAPVTPSATPSAPAGTPTPTPGGPGDPGESTGDDPVIDMTAFQKIAAETVRAYATFTSTEPAAEREARILAAGGSPAVARGITGLALAGHDGSVNWSARSGTVGKIYAGYTSQTETTITFNVVSDYWGSYETPEASSQQGRGTWKVTVAYTRDNAGNPVPGQVTAITEPRFNLS